MSEKLDSFFFTEMLFYGKVHLEELSGTLYTSGKQNQKINTDEYK